MRNWDEPAGVDVERVATATRGSGVDVRERLRIVALVFALVFAVFALAPWLVAPAAAQQPIAPPDKPGFPVVLSGAGTVRYSHPAIADLGLENGKKQIIFGTVSRDVYVMLSTGAIAPGWPQRLPAEINASPTIADLDGDDVPDIVIGYGSNFTPKTHGGIAAFHRDGTRMWTRQTGDFDENGWQDGVVGTPSVADIDGDGKVEVAWTSFDSNVYLVDGETGADRPEFPNFVRDTIWSSPALADLDGDGKLEIIVGVDAHLEGRPFGTPDGGCLHVFRFDGSELNGFPRCIDQAMDSSPVVGDIDGDGAPEIVVGTGVYFPNGTHVIYAFEIDGSDVPGWPVAIDGQEWLSPALADIDGDDVVDVIVTSDNTGPSGQYHLDVFRGDGTRVFPSVVPKSFFGLDLSAAAPIVADITGDGEVEILFPTSTEVCVVSRFGEQLTDDGSHDGRFSMYTETGLGNVAVDDLDGDGVPEVVAISGTPFPSGANTIVHVWNPTRTPTIAPPWGMFRRTPDRLGVAPGTPAGTGARYMPLDDYIRMLHADFLEREPSPEELAYWKDEIDSGRRTRAQVGLHFLDLPEYRRSHATVVQYFFGMRFRRPTYKEITKWTAFLDDGGCSGSTCSEEIRQALADTFVQSTDFQRRIPPSTDDDQFVTLVYQNVLKFTPGSQEIDNWVGELRQGNMTRAEVVRSFVETEAFVEHRKKWDVLVLLGFEGFLEKVPKKGMFQRWRNDLALALPPEEFVQFLITQDRYLARFVP